MYICSKTYIINEQGWFQRGRQGGLKTLKFSNHVYHFAWFIYFTIQNDKNDLEFHMFWVW